MTIFEGSRVVVIVADYIALDQGAGKLTLLGAGFTVTGVDPQTGMTPRQAVAVLVDIPRRFAGQSVNLAISLRDITNDQAVKVPGPTGQPEALRIQNPVVIAPPMAPPGVQFSDDLFCRVQTVLEFPTGLPLRPGTEYAWQVHLDDRSRPGWKAHFEVARPAPGPVFGGIAGPADIPGIAHVETIEEEPEEQGTAE